MIYFVTCSEHKYTVKWLIDLSQIDFSKIVKSLSYKDLEFFEPDKNDTLIFCDHERLVDAENLLLLKKRIEELSSKCITLNSNIGAGNRIELLDKLYSKGVNKHRCFELKDEFEKALSNYSINYPVFIKEYKTHQGSFSKLLLNSLQLKEELGKDLNFSELCLIEFAETELDGVFYKKYGTFFLKKQLIHRHIQMAKEWEVKNNKSDSINTSASEYDFVNSTLFFDQLQNVIEISGLDYGRIDFGVNNGSVVIFEINTNPTIIDPDDLIDESRLGSTRTFLSNFYKAIKRLSYD